MSSELEQRSFGRTGEKVSVIGLSGAALYKHSYELGVATVKHALDLGVTYFDTSPAYGEHSPEGPWLAGGISQLIMGEGLDGTTRPHLPGGDHILLSKYQEQVVLVPSSAFALGRYASLWRSLLLEHVQSLRRRMDRFSAALPCLTLLASSLNATSNTQWTEFSIPQCVLTLDSSIWALFGKLDM